MDGRELRGWGRGQSMGSVSADQGNYTILYILQYDTEKLLYRSILTMDGNVD